MASRFLTVAFRLTLLVALVGSAALLVDYLSASAPAFCGVQGGCARVRDSEFSHLFGVPVPFFGVMVFGALLLNSTVKLRPFQRYFLTGLAVLAALGAMGFIGLQLFVIRAICPWCMLVDVATIATGVLALFLIRRKAVIEPLSLRLLWVAAGVAAVVVPMVWEHAPAPAQVPAGVAKHERPGEVTMIMFTDFACPYCRRLHPVADGIVEDHAGKVRVVRLMRPLSFHPGADLAALAYICSPDDKLHAMAGALYGAKEAERTIEGLVAIARRLGMPAAKMARCIEAPESKERLEQEIALFKEAALRGLPATFVGSTVVQGANEASLRQAVAQALSGQQRGSQLPWMFGMLAVIFGGVAALTLRHAWRVARFEPGEAED